MIQNTLIVNKGIDTSDATATAGDVLNGKTFYANGIKVTGNIPTKTESNLTSSGATVTVPAGYYPSQVRKSVATATQATPSISVDSTGKITASATQSAGYVSSGTKSATKQLTTQAAQTITPGTSNKTIASGRYLTGTQTIKGDANLVAANIKSGVSIFGVVGTAESAPKTISVTVKNSTGKDIEILTNKGSSYEMYGNGGTATVQCVSGGALVIVAGKNGLTESNMSGVEVVGGTKYTYSTLGFKVTATSGTASVTVS